MSAGYRRLYEYGLKQHNERKGCPMSDPITLLSNAVINGCPLKASEVAHNGVQLMLDSGLLTRGEVSIDDNGGVDVVCEDHESSAKFEDKYPGRVWCPGFRW